MSAATAPRRFAETSAGRIAYSDRGEGPVALFVHGVFLNGDLWRDVVEGVARHRRCVCPDLLAHGWTQEGADADLSFSGQARMLVEFLDTLGIDRVDLVGNDSGGGIAQILAARHPDRIRTLTLTNCDTHDDWPPEAFLPTVQLMTGDGGGDLLRAFAADPAAARNAFAVALEHPERVDDERLLGFFEPLVASPERIEAFIGFFRAMRCADTAEVESLLARLPAPTLIVWGNDDVFFDVRMAHWLRDTLPNVHRLVEIRDGRLLLPIDRHIELAAELLMHWEPESLRERLALAG